MGQGSSANRTETNLAPILSPLSEGRKGQDLYVRSSAKCWPNLFNEKTIQTSDPRDFPLHPRTHIDPHSLLASSSQQPGGFHAHLILFPHGDWMETEAWGPSWDPEMEGAEASGRRE